MLADHLGKRHRELFQKILKSLFGPRCSMQRHIHATERLAIRISRNTTCPWRPNMDALGTRQCSEKTLRLSIVASGFRRCIGPRRHRENRFLPRDETALLRPRKQKSGPAVSCTRQAFAVSREVPAGKVPGQLHHCADRENAGKRPAPERFSNTEGIPCGIEKGQKRSVWPECDRCHGRCGLLRKRARPANPARSLGSPAAAKGMPLLTPETNAGRRTLFHPCARACRWNNAERKREPCRPPENALRNTPQGTRIFVRNHNLAGHHPRQRERGFRTSVEEGRRKQRSHRPDARRRSELCQDGP